MDELKNVLKQIQDILDNIIRDTGMMKPDDFEIVGVFSNENNVFLVERLTNGDEYLIPSEDGINFDSTKKFPRKEFEEDAYFFVPVSLENWNHPARSNVYPRTDKFDHANITVLGEYETEKGMLVLYDCSYNTAGYQRLIGGGFVCSKYANKFIDWRSEESLWDEFIKNTEGNTDQFKPLGVTFYQGKYHIYYYRNNEIYSIKVADPFSKIAVEIARTQVRKYISNPVLAPKKENQWESMATFNPAVVAHNDNVHMFYRAQGFDHLSVVGYAESKDGYNFDRLPYPVYVPDIEFTHIKLGLKPFDPRRISGDSWGGVEDPRATVIGDKLHLIYVAFDGWSEPRLAMSTINISDVENQNWQGWSEPMFLTPWSNVWGTGNKSGVLFPRQINGKYVFMHRFWPNICVDYVNDLEFGERKKYLQISGQIKVRRDHWDSLKIGAGAPPIETEEGWLLIYFGVGYQDRSKYKIGAMILDRDNPEKVIYRSSAPIISPEEWYENEGKPGVAYPCGAIVKDEDLIMYYGGGDAVVCAASCKLNDMLYDLKKDIVEPNLMKPLYVHS